MDLTKKEITDYFRSNIFEAYSAYTGWKVLFASKSSAIVSKEMAERYVEVQNYHNNFFRITERSFLIQFILLSLHAFDPDDNSLSLYKVDKEKTKKFKKGNKKIIDSLRNLRNKLFAHRDIEIDTETIKQLKIPSIKDLDIFFKNLMGFYNSLTSILHDSHTMFQNAEEIKYDTERLFMNVYRGEQSRKHEINIKWSWENNNKKISDVI